MASPAAVGRAVDFVPSPLTRARRCRLRRELSDEECASCRPPFFRARTGADLRSRRKSITAGCEGAIRADPVRQKYAVPATRAGGTAGRGNAGDATNRRTSAFLSAGNKTTAQDFFLLDVMLLD